MQARQQAPGHSDDREEAHLPEGREGRDRQASEARDRRERTEGERGTQAPRRPIRILPGPRQPVVDQQVVRVVDGDAHQRRAEGHGQAVEIAEDEHARRRRDQHAGEGRYGHQQEAAQ